MNIAFGQVRTSLGAPTGMVPVQLEQRKRQLRCAVLCCAVRADVSGRHRAQHLSIGARSRCQQAGCGDGMMCGDGVHAGTEGGRGEHNTLSRASCCCSDALSDIPQ